MPCSCRVTTSGRAEGVEAPAHGPGRTGRRECGVEDPEQFLVATEVGEMLEREIDGASHGARRAQFEQLVMLSFVARHGSSLGDWPVRRLPCR